MIDFNQIKIGTLNSKGTFVPHRQSITFRHISEQYEISKKFNNGEFDYYLVREIMNIEEMMSEKEANDYKKKNGGKWAVQISCVSPQRFLPKNRISAMAQDGEYTNWDEIPVETQVMMITSQFGGAVFVSKAGPNLKKLLSETAKEAYTKNFLFGFAMDECQNRVGGTGWDFIKGERFPTPDEPSEED